MHAFYFSTIKVKIHMGIDSLWYMKKKKQKIIYYNVIWRCESCFIVENHHYLTNSTMND